MTVPTEFHTAAVATDRVESATTPSPETPANGYTIEVSLVCSLSAALPPALTAPSSIKAQTPGRPCRRCGGPRLKYRRCLSCRAAYARQRRTRKRTKMLRAFINQIATEDLTGPEMNALVRDASRRVGGGRRLATLVHEDMEDARRVARKGRGYRRILRHLMAMAKIDAAVGVVKSRVASRA